MFTTLRNVDPDNDVLNGGSHVTTHTIVNQFPLSTQALVTAIGDGPGCFLGIGSLDSRAVVSYGGFINRSASDVYNGLVGKNHHARLVQHRR